MKTYFSYCRYSGVALDASNILSRFIHTPTASEHPLFGHRLAHVLRIAANDTLTGIERRVVVACLIKHLRTVEFRCSILPDDYLTSEIIARLASIVSKLGALPESAISAYPKYVITEETRDLRTFNEYLSLLLHEYLFKTQGILTTTIASQELEQEIQNKIDDAPTKFNHNSVNARLLSWAFSFIRDYEMLAVIKPRTIALMDYLESNPTKTWKSLYNGLNKQMRRLLSKECLEELREHLFEMVPDNLQDRAKRIIVIRYVDALIEGQQKDLISQLSELGMADISKREMKSVSGVSYMVKTVNEISNSDRPKRSDFSSAVEFANALAAFGRSNK